MIAIWWLLPRLKNTWIHICIHTYDSLLLASSCGLRLGFGIWVEAWILHLGLCLGMWIGLHGTLGIGPWTLDLRICRNCCISSVVEAFWRVRKLWIVCHGVSSVGNVVISLVCETLLNMCLEAWALDLGPWTLGFAETLIFHLVLEAFWRVRKLGIVCLGVSRFGNVVISLVL